MLVPVTETLVEVSIVVVRVDAVVFRDDIVLEEVVRVLDNEVTDEVLV